jgi:hypothetical protein
MPIPFAALAALTQSIMGIGQSGANNQLLGMQISEAKDGRRKAERLARASTTDANGNTIRYNEGMNAWETEVAPLIKAILDSQNKEQYKSLTEDAPMQREARKRKDARSRSAGTEYDEKFAKRTNRNERSEEDYQADAVLSSARKRNSVPPSLFTAAVRTGNPKALQQLVAAARGQEGSLSDTLNTARETGTGSYLKDRAMRDQVDFGELGQLKGIADDTDSPGIANNNSAEMLAGRQQGAMAQLINAIQQGSSSVSGALGNAAGKVQAPDFGALINSIGGFFPEKEDPNAVALAKAIQESQLAEAQYKTKDYRTRMSQF